MQKDLDDIMAYNKEYMKEYYLKNKHKRNLDVIKEATRRWRNNNPEKRIYVSAKSRAKRLGIEFNIELSDIVIPEYCPILKTKLERVCNTQANSTPALDRIDNNKGYIKGNVAVISHKANRMKSNMTIDEITRLYEYVK